MHGNIAEMQYAMQNAARLERMIGYIMIERRFNRKTRQQCIAVMTMVIDRIHAVSDMMGIACQKFMLRLCRPFACVPKCKQVMPTLHFLQKQDIRRHGCDGLLDAMNPRPGTYRTDTLVNIPGGDAKFHAAWRSNVGRNISRVVSRGIRRGINRGIRRFIGRNRGLDVSGNGYEDSTVLG
jgi:hypothetical protein